jgi:hypothetical protein
MNSLMNRFALGLLSVSLLAPLTLTPALAQPAANPNVVSGKVVAVSHEKTTVNNVVLDKITVTVESCEQRGALKTVHYSPATVSDRTVLGHLFQQNAASAITPNMPAQQQFNGYGLFWVDATQRVLRTGILGHGQSCPNVPGFLSQF